MSGFTLPSPLFGEAPCIFVTNENRIRPHRDKLNKNFIGTKEKDDEII